VGLGFAEHPARHRAGEGEHRGTEPGLRPRHGRGGRHHLREHHQRPAFSLLLPRENGQSPVYTGHFPMVAGLRILPSPNITGAGTTGAIALVADTKALGGMADENLGGPGYVSALAVLACRPRRSARTRSTAGACATRRVTVPIVLEPAAAWKITGVEA
jgi:hypothetical protein